MRAVPLLLLLLCVVLDGCGPSAESPADRESPPQEPPLATEKTRGPVTVRLEVEPAKPTLSDDIRLTLIIRAEEGVEVERPAIRPAAGEFVLRDFKHELPDVQDGVHVQRSRFVLEALRSGPHLIRPVRVKFRMTRPGAEGETGKDYEVVTDPLKVEVGSILGDQRPDLATIRGPRGLVDLAPPEARVPWLWIGLGLGAIAVVVTSVVVLRRRRRAPEERRLSPEELAYMELQALVQADLVAEERYGDFYVELTGIVRRYIERTTRVHAPEQTTEEFLREIRDQNLFPVEKQTQFKVFLEAADLIKFAAQVPGTEEIESSFNTAKAFVGLETKGKAA
jgi:hypothetical protein